MNAFRTGMSQDRRNVRTRWMTFSLGIALTLTSMAEEGMPSASSVTNSTAGREPPATVTPALRGTILSARSAETRVIITDASGHEQLYARGDEISPGTSVVDIHRTYVVLRRNGRLEKIDFSRRSAEPMLEESTTTAEPGGAPPENDPVALRNAMLTHPALLFQSIGAAPVFDGERFSGYRVMQSEDPAFLDSLGLKPGDILTAVNGVSLTTPDHGAGLLDSLSGTGRLTFTVRRGSTTLVLDH